MRTTTRFVLGLGTAGVVAAGGSAYTQAITISNPVNDKLGYGAVAVSGVTVTNIRYVPDESAADKLLEIRFTVTADADNPVDATNDLSEDNNNAYVAFDENADTVGAKDKDCDVVSNVLITCTWSAGTGPSLASIRKTHLTVVANGS